VHLHVTATRRPLVHAGHDQAIGIKDADAVAPGPDIGAMLLEVGQARPASTAVVCAPQTCSWIDRSPDVQRRDTDLSGEKVQSQAATEG
jgi:hypothetical protein